MSEPTATSQLESLRQEAAQLETENAYLRGRGPASRGSVEAIQRNTHLRRQVEVLRGRLPAADLGAGPDPGAFLTIHQVASRLNTTAEQASRRLAKVETRRDGNGVQVIAAETFEQFVVDAAAGENPSRFL